MPDSLNAAKAAASGSDTVLKIVGPLDLAAVIPAWIAAFFVKSIALGSQFAGRVKTTRKVILSTAILVRASSIAPIACCHKQLR